MSGIILIIRNYNLISQNTNFFVEKKLRYYFTLKWIFINSKKKMVFF